MNFKSQFLSSIFLKPRDDYFDNCKIQPKKFNYKKFESTKEFNKYSKQRSRSGPSNSGPDCSPGFCAPVFVFQFSSPDSSFTPPLLLWFKRRFRCRKQFNDCILAASKFVSVRSFSARKVLISCFQFSFARNLPEEKVLREFRFGEMKVTIQIATVQGEQKSTKNRTKKTNAWSVHGFPVAENHTHVTTQKLLVRVLTGKKFNQEPIASR